MVTSFQTGSRCLHFRSASYIRVILSTWIRAFCNLPLVGSWLFRVAVVISVRYPPSLAVPKIMRALGVHFTNRISAVLSGVGRVDCAYVSPSCFSSVSLSLFMTSAVSSAVVAIAMSSTYAQYSSSVVNSTPLLSHLIFEFRQRHPQSQNKSNWRLACSPRSAGCLPVCSPRLLIVPLSFLPTSWRRFVPAPDIFVWLLWQRHSVLQRQTHSWCRTQWRLSCGSSKQSPVLHRHGKFYTDMTQPPSELTRCELAVSMMSPVWGASPQRQSASPYLLRCLLQLLWPATKAQRTKGGVSCLPTIASIL